MIDYSKHTVLIVDDEVEILKSLNRGLHSEPYKRIFASSGAQALDLFARENQISVIITDMRMPGMNGLDLLKSISEISPETVKIVLTGYTQLPQILATINHVDVYKILTKPWDLETELKVYIKEAIEIYEKTITNSTLVVTSEKKNLLYNKMLSDSYEKIDHVLKLYDELIKAINQHHLYSVQALRKIKDPIEISLVTKQMNDRMHYLNKIFEMSRYALKAFNVNDIKDFILKGLVKFETDAIEFSAENGSATATYFDNFKMLSVMFIDLIEMIQINGGGIERIQLNEKYKQGIEIIITSKLNLTEKKILNDHNMFVESVVKIIGGSYELSNFENNNEIKLYVPLKVKTEQSLAF